MSNFSNTYQCYLQGYCGETSTPDRPFIDPTERQMQATALGVYHRVAAKLPMMSSVAVVAELRRMQAETKQSFFDVVLQKIDETNPLGAISTVRHLTGLTLINAKGVVDRVRAGASELILTKVEHARAEAAAKSLRDYGCTVEVV